MNSKAWNDGQHHFQSFRLLLEYTSSSGIRRNDATRQSGVKAHNVFMHAKKANHARSVPKAAPHGRNEIVRGFFHTFIQWRWRDRVSISQCVTHKPNETTIHTSVNSRRQIYRKLENRSYIHCRGSLSCCQDQLTATNYGRKKRKFVLALHDYCM